MNALSFGYNQMPTQIRVLGVRRERFELSSIFAAVEIVNTTHVCQMAPLERNCGTRLQSSTGPDFLDMGLTAETILN
jgi:hypothetical protein